MASPIARRLAAFACLVLVTIVSTVAPTSAHAGTSWPTMHNDYQRSGHTDEVLPGPMQRKWFRSFHEEMVGPRVEAIVAEGLCLLGTYAGNFYALDVVDGRSVWTYQAGGPIGHSACFADGKVFFCTDEGAEAGSIVCLEARTGKLLWKYDAGAGIFNSPACDGRQVYVGDRAGRFHAVDAATGRGNWVFPTGYMILKPASFSLDGQRIVFGSEDMHVYCLSREGKLLWKSAKLPGLSLRDGAPTIWAGKAIVRTNPANPFHESLFESRKLLAEIQRGIPLAAEDKVVLDNKNSFYLDRTDRRERAEYEGVLQYLKDHPHRRTWFTLELDDGREPWIAPVMFTSGLHNPPTPPTFNPKTNELYTIMTTALSVYCSGVSQTGIGIGRIDPKTGYLTNIAHDYSGREPGYFAGMSMITDETSALSLMGDFLVVTHQGAVGGVDLVTRKIRQLHGARDSYGMIFGPGVHGGWDGARQLASEGFVENVMNEWHGPDRSIVAIAEGRMFWVVGGQLVCFAGPDQPTTESGGNKAPEPFRWSKMPRINGANVTGSFGQYDETTTTKTLSVADVRPYAAVPPDMRTSDRPLAARLRARLDTSISELVDGAPWAYLMIELGISHEERHFWRSSDTFRAVAMALPHLSPETRRKATDYLDRLFVDGAVLDRPVVGIEGRRREYYDLSPELRERHTTNAPKAAATIADLYAVWVYAQYGNRWDKVGPSLPDLLARFRSDLGGSVALSADADDGRAVAELNRQIAGVIGYIRLAEKAGLADDAQAGLRRLAELASQRVNFEIADPRLQSRREHHASIPRYENLTPEVARLLADHATPQLTANLADLRRELPVWYQAWSERLIGGENYTNTPTMAWGIFLAIADSGAVPPETLVRYLDQPWCRADLYYIEKLAAALRALGAAN